MLIAVWIVSGLLAAAMLFAGATKALTPREKLAKQMGWVEDFSPAVVKLIGVAEVLGAIGLILPALTGILPILTPLAAVGIAILQLGAIVTHVRRKEYQVLPANVVLLAMALFVAIARFAGV